MSTFVKREFPFTRLRRTRNNVFSREIMQETRLCAQDLIQPFFIIDGKNTKQAIASMPGIERLTIDLLIEAAQQLYQQGSPALALFPVLGDNFKTDNGEHAYDEKGLMQRAIRALKKEIPEMGVITDVALDPYTSHGQDGILNDEGYIVNDETVEILTQQALSHAHAGADVIAPSDMMDGRIMMIREALERQGFCNTQILAYSAKYASCFYGPFRDAVDSLTRLGKADKKTYQMDPANHNEALHEVAMDIEEGADMVMVKPGLSALDVVFDVKQTFKIPTLVYQVSGEYAMIKAAAEKGWINEQDAILESLASIKRAGADAILSYYTTTALSLL